MSVALTAQIRTTRGKGGARRARAAGQCPAVIYGPGTEPMSVQVDPKVLLKLMHGAGENTLFDLQVVEGDRTVAEKKAIVREIQYDPFRPLPNHVDFYCVSLDRAIEVSVPVELAGTPTAVAQKIGTLTLAMHELTVECLPDRIPAKITVDVSGLELNRAVHVREVVVPEGVTLLDAPEQTVVSLAPVHEEAAAAPAAEAAEPEVIRERKPAEES